MWVVTIAPHRCAYYKIYYSNSTRNKTIMTQNNGISFSLSFVDILNQSLDYKISE